MTNSTPRKLARQHPGYVYLIVQYENDPNRRLVKIGISRNPLRRLSQLQTGNPHALFHHHLMMCHSMSAARAIESALHEVYAARRIPRSEWFNFSSSKIWDRKKGHVPDDSAWDRLSWMFAIAAVANPPDCVERVTRTYPPELDPMELYLKEQTRPPRPRPLLWPRSTWATTR